MTRKKRKEYQLILLQCHSHRDFRSQGREEQFSKFLDIFKKIEINIPFAEVISQMPLSAKFLKEILSKKRKIAEEGIVNLTATCSAIIQQKLPAKMKDPGSFTIPYSIGKYEFKKGSKYKFNASISGADTYFGGTYPNSNYITDG